MVLRQIMGGATIAQLPWASRSALALCLVIMLALAGTAHSHEVRPAVADLEIGPDRVEISVRLSLEALLAGIDLSQITDTNQAPNAAEHDELRKLAPALLEQRLRDGWETLGDSFILQAGGGRHRLQIDKVQIPDVGDPETARDSVLKLSAALPLDVDGSLEFGWRKENGPLIVRQTGVGDDAYTGYLKDGALTPPLPRTGALGQSGWQVFVRYIAVGFEHIIPKGLDHILFVLGLFFFSFHWRPLLVQITAFTAAHTITLALAVLGYVQLPAHIVEPLIALSIVYVAVENLFAPALRLWRPALVFAFGLLHGLGFASVLMEVGLSATHLAAGLAGFNIGVELGQLAVVGTAILVLAVPFGSWEWYRKAIAVPCSVMIAGIGAYWFVERVFA
ncbi:MAG: HupE/UreJ family protein [Pseudomonadota bacterium]